MDDGCPYQRAAIEAHYLRLGPRMLRYLERRTGDRAVAADLLQDVFLGLLRSPVEFPSEREAQSYLFRAAYSRLVDQARRERRSRILDWFRPSNQRSEIPRHGAIEAVFRRLRQRDATLLWLAYVEEMTHQEIAQVLGLRSASVKVLLHRARGRMRKAIKALGLDPEDLA